MKSREREHKTNINEGEVGESAINCRLIESTITKVQKDVGCDGPGFHLPPRKADKMDLKMLSFLVLLLDFMLLLIPRSSLAAFTALVASYLHENEMHSLAMHKKLHKCTLLCMIFKSNYFAGEGGQEGS